MRRPDGAGRPRHPGAPGRSNSALIIRVLIAVVLIQGGYILKLKISQMRIHAESAAAGTEKELVVPVVPSGETATVKSDGSSTSGSSDSSETTSAPAENVSAEAGAEQTTGGAGGEAAVERSAERTNDAPHGASGEVPAEEGEAAGVGGLRGVAAAEGDSGAGDGADATSAMVLPPADPVATWPPLTGPSDGMTCRAWLEEEDKVAESRNFEENPILVTSSEVKRWDCDVPCEFVNSDGSEVDASLSSSVPGKMVLRSMEARSYYPINDPEAARRTHSVVMTVHYDSDVPVQYGSWEEYDIMRPLSAAPKSEAALAAAFISNCNANNFRLQAVEALQRHLKVHSFGRCLNNMPYEQDKLSAISRYRFTLAFENSCEPDYLTEKFWQALVAGSVPVVVGAPNIADFAPANNSFLHIRSLDDIPAIAQQMKTLASDESTYSEMLQWKTKGPSDSFLANLDLSAVHSSCRLCILLADRIRKQDVNKRLAAAAAGAAGAAAADDADADGDGAAKPRPCRCSMPRDPNSPSGRTTLYHLYVRERGTFRYTSVFLPSDALTLRGVRRAIRRAFQRKAYRPVWVGKRPKVLVSEKKIKALKIYHVYPAGSTQREAMFGGAWFRDTEQFVEYVNKHPCAQLEVIFI